MKKKNCGKKTAYSIVAGAVLASAAFLPGCNRPESVYGPPPEFQTSSEYSTPENLNPTVYGPPSTEETTVAETTASEFNTDENIIAGVYGPPEDMTLTPSTPYLEPETFDPSINEPIDVYGPPIAD